MIIIIKIKSCPFKKKIAKTKKKLIKINMWSCDPIVYWCNLKQAKQKKINEIVWFSCQ